MYDVRIILPDGDVLANVVSVKGERGNGIVSVVKTGTQGLVDTYTITYDDGNTDTFTINNGEAATVSVGNVSTGAAGSSATVTNTGDNHNAVFDFAIPQGVKGDTATVTVGTVTTGAAGSNVVITNSGTNTDAVLNFTIPKGDKGDPGQVAGLVWGNLEGTLSNQTDLQNALDTLQGNINLKEDKSNSDIKNTFTIATTDWTADTTFGDYTVKASISITGVTVNDLCDIYYDETTKPVAEEAKATGVKTKSGGIEIYAETTPSGAISGTYKIAKVVVS